MNGSLFVSPSTWVLHLLFCRFVDRLQRSLYVDGNQDEQDVYKIKSFDDKKRREAAFELYDEEEEQKKDVQRRSTSGMARAIHKFSLSFNSQETNSFKLFYFSSGKEVLCKVSHSTRKSHLYLPISASVVNSQTSSLSLFQSNSSSQSHSCVRILLIVQYYYVH